MPDNSRLNPGTAGDLIRSIHRDGGSGPKTQVTQLDVGGGGATESLVSESNPLPSKVTHATRSDTYTATGNGTAVDVSLRPCKWFSLQVKGTGAAATVWTVLLEGSLDGTNYYEILRHASANPSGDNVDGAVVWFEAGPFLYFRSRCSDTLTLGSASNIVATIVGMQ